MIREVELAVSGIMLVEIFLFQLVNKTILVENLVVLILLLEGNRSILNLLRWLLPHDLGSLLLQWHILLLILTALLLEVYQVVNVILLLLFFASFLMAIPNVRRVFRQLILFLLLF